MLVELHVDWERAGPETLVATLGLSTRATNALDRVGVATVRQLVGLPVGAVRFMRGVGRKTRDELIAAIDRLRRRFPDLEAAPAAPTTPAPDGGPEDRAALDLDALRLRLIEPPARGKAAPAALAVRRAYLGLDDGPDGPPGWPTQAEVAARLGKKKQQVGQALKADRDRWANDPAVTALRDELRGMIAAAGGVSPLAELAEALVASRGGAADDPVAGRRLAAALVRVAFEAEQTLTGPRIVLRRTGGSVLLARSPELAEFADRLGRVADELAAEDPLPPSLRVFARLYEVEQPEFPPDCPPPNNDRLLRLAAAASAHAAVSTRQELYPRGMSARRALALGLGALTGLELPAADRRGERERFDPPAVRARIAARYPEAEELPDRPELDELLAEAGLEVAWDEAAGVYRRPGGEGADPGSSGSTRPGRFSTDLDGPRAAISEEEAEARAFDERLRFALRDRAFLALTVRPSRMLDAERELLRRFPDLQRLSFDRLLLDRLRAEAEALEVDWSVVLDADGAPPGSEDREHLLGLVRRVVPAVEAELLGSERPVLLAHPGLIARYDLMDLVERLRDRVGRRGVCPGLWVLVAADEQCDLPVIDGREVPLIGSGQRARVPLAWIENRDRSAVPIGPSARVLRPLA